MTSKISSYRWGRLIIAALSVVVLTFLLITAVVTVYATSLAIKAMGAPDQERITQFADSIAPILSPILTIILTFLAALWINRKTVDRKIAHSLIVSGLVIFVGLISDLVFGGSFALLTIGFWILTLLAGWFGGWLASGKKKD